MIPIFYAVDTDDYDAAERLLTILGDHVDVKFGPEFILAHGAEGCARLARAGKLTRKRSCFIDVKLHDIPATVANGVRSIIKNFDADFISLHTCDGSIPLKAAMEVAEFCEQQGFKRPKLLGVTVLTSTGSRTWEDDIRDRASFARQAKLDGVICPASAIPLIRAMNLQYDWEPFLMVPGIRSNGVGLDDQISVATPREAMEAGAEAIVMGRELRLSSDPLATVLAIRE